MRAYLLGTLESREASDLEVSYFTDPDRLRWVQGIEEELIEDYLERRLPNDDRERFEARYLQVPELRSKVESVRARRHSMSRESWFGSWPSLRLALVCGGIFAIAGGFSLYLRRQPLHTVSVSGASGHYPTPAIAPIAIALSPGVSMGPGAKAAEVSIPSGGAKLAFGLELPGVTGQFDCSVRFLSVEADGRPRSVWVSPPVRSVSTASGVVLTVTPDSSRLPSGDYIIEVATADGTVLEKYLVRLSHR